MIYKLNHICAEPGLYELFKDKPKACKALVSLTGTAGIFTDEQGVDWQVIGWCDENGELVGANVILEEEFDRYVEGDSSGDCFTSKGLPEGFTCKTIPIEELENHRTLRFVPFNLGRYSNYPEEEAKLLFVQSILEDMDRLAEEAK